MNQRLISLLCTIPLILFSSCASAPIKTTENLPVIIDAEDIENFSFDEIIVVPSNPVVISMSLTEANKLDRKIIEKELLALINAKREESNVTSLDSDSDLLKAARIRARELRRQFSHTRPDKTNFQTVLDEIDFKYAKKTYGENASRVVYENLSFTEEEIALRMFTGLEKSKSHLKNMLNKKYKYVGVGVYVSRTGDRVYITSAQIFCS